MIRKMIKDASDKEASTGILLNHFRSNLQINNAQQKEQTAKGLVAIVKAYIEHVPNLLDEAERVSRQTTWWNSVSPVLEAAQQYFFDPVDLIPDNLGIAGLIDDAYLTHTLLQTISDRFENQFGSPMMSGDMTEANAFMRNVIGEPVVSQLDNYVRTLVDGPNMQNIMQQLFAYGSMMNNYIPEASFGGMSTHDYANLQSDLVITSYSPSW